MKKKNIFITIVLLAIIITGVILYTKQIRYAGITWPFSSTLEKSSEEDVSIILNEAFQTSHGSWPLKTEFLISNNVIKQIEVFDDFIFYGFKFNVGALIEHKSVDGEDFYDLFIKEKLVIDGLDLHGECIIEFKANVLFSARCPEFEKVYFKRFIAPDALEYSEEGEELKVDS